MDTRRRFRVLDETLVLLLGLMVMAAPLLYLRTAVITEFMYSKAFYLNALCFTAAAVYFVRALLRNGFNFRRGATFLSLAVFCGVAAQSLIGAPNPWKGLETITKVAPALVFLVLLYQEARTRERARLFLMLTAIAAIGVLAVGILQYHEVLRLPRDYYGAPDPSSTVGLTNFVMEFLMPFMFVFPVLAFTERAHVRRLVFAAAAGMQYYYFVLSDNRAAMLGWVAGAALGALLLFAAAKRGGMSIPRRRLAMFAVAGLLVLGALAASGHGARVATRFASIFEPAKDDSIRFRLETWKQTLRVFADYPLRGVGLSNTEIVFPLYQTPFLERMTLRHNTRLTAVHNEYLQVFGDLGILGVAALAWFLFALARLMLSALRRAQDRDAALLAGALVAGLGAFLVVAFFSFPLQLPASALSFFLAVAMLEILNDAAEPPSTAPRLPQSWVAPVAGVGLMAAVLFGAYQTVWLFNAMRAAESAKLASNAHARRNSALAKSLIEEAIALHPQKESYLYDRVRFALTEGDSVEAIRRLEELARIQPNYAIGRRQLGMLAARMGNFEKAIKEFEHAYRIYPTTQHEVYLPLLVDAYINAGRAADAVESAEKAAAGGAASTEVLYQLGRAYAANGDAADAASSLKRVVDADPEHLEARVALEAALVEAGRHADALTLLTEPLALKLTREERFTRELARTKAYAGLGRVTEAVASIRAFLASDPAAVEKLRGDDSLTRLPELRAVLAP